MSLASRKAIKYLLKKYTPRDISSDSEKYQTRPSKRLGQNFLIDKWVIKKIIKAADLKPKDVILEIGPGIGTLTIELAKKVKRVIAVEKDPKMIEILKETLKEFQGVEVIQGDIRKIENLKLEIENYKIVANLPFYLTAPVIRQFLELSKNRPQSMTLVVQREVAQRICAKPPRMNLLAVSVQFYAKPEIISYVSKKSFWPQPKVDSAIVKIVHQKALTKPVLVDLFFRIVKAGFSQPRKQLINNLTKRLTKSTGVEKVKMREWLLENNIQPTQRAETLTINDWLKLTKSMPCS